MDELEMLMELISIIRTQRYECINSFCEDCEFYGHTNCSCEKPASAVIKANYRKINDDEIVVKESEYKESQDNKRKAYIMAQEQEQSCIEGYLDGYERGQSKAKKDTIREILNELNDEGYKIYKQQGNTFDADNFNWLIAHTMQKYDIK